MLSAAALVSQAHIQVVRGELGSSPVSLFCISIAESGDRKSTLDRLVLSPIRKYEEDRQIKCSDLEKKYRADLEAF